MFTTMSQSKLSLDVSFLVLCCSPCLAPIALFRLGSRRTLVHLLRCSGRAARTDLGAVGTGRTVDNRTRHVPEDGPPLGFFFYPFIRLGAGWAVTPKEPAVDGPDGSNNSLAMHQWFSGGWNCCEMGANGNILFGVAESHCWFPIGEHGGNHMPQTMFCPMARMINQSISTCNSWVDEPLLLSNVTVAQPNLNPLFISHRHGK